MTAKELDGRLQSFDYGYMERRNRPPAVKLDDQSIDLGINAIHFFVLLCCCTTLWISGTGVPCVEDTAESSESDREVTALCQRPPWHDLYAGTAPGLLSDHGPMLRLSWRDISRESLFSFGDVSRGLCCLWSHGNGRFSAHATPTCCIDPTMEGPTRRSWLVLILLLLSGNVHPNPGPTLIQIQTPDELKSSNGLRYFFHLNVRSLINKMDSLRVCADTTGADTILLLKWCKNPAFNAS